MNKRFYNLDGLRFLAAILIVGRHFHSVCEFYDISGFARDKFLYVAQPAVSLFFVISGYLITHVLCKNESIDLTRFYRNRALRIWPLYYLVVFISFFITPHISAFTLIDHPVDHLNTRQFLGYLFFLPNTTDFFLGSTHFLGVTWSLGVEEFFYLFFPLILFFTPAKWRVGTLLILTILFLSISIWASYVTVPDHLPYRYELILHRYLPRYRIYAFLLGSIVFLLVNAGNTIKWLQYLGSKAAAYLIWLTIPILFISGVYFGKLNEPVISIFFAAGLYSLGISRIRFSLLDNKLINYLGKISYGIYLLHSFLIVLVINILHPYIPNMRGGSVILFSVVCMATIVSAAIIYECYEKWFLRFKKF